MKIFIEPGYLLDSSAPTLAAEKVVVVVTRFQPIVHQSLVNLVAILLIAQVALFCDSSALLAQTDSFDVLAARKGMFEARKQIHSGEVVIKVRRPIWTHDKIQEQFEQTRHVWFNKDFVRHDQLDSWLDGSKQMRHSDIIGPKHSILAIPGAPIEVADAEATGIPDRDVFNPRWLGLLPRSFDSACSASLDEITQDLERGPPPGAQLLVEDSELDGTKVVRATYTTEKVKILVHFGTGELKATLVDYELIPIGDEVTTPHIQWHAKYRKSNGINFPSEVSYQWSKGGTIERQEHVEVLSANFNQDIRSGLFGIGAIESDFKGVEVIRNGNQLFPDIGAYQRSMAK